MNPRAILNMADTDESLFRLCGSKPGELFVDDIKNAEELADIGVLRIINGRVYAACPIFVSSDESILRRITCTYAEQIARKIAKHANAYYDIADNFSGSFEPGVHLYHLLCGAVFDGCFFDRLADSGLLTVSKPQKNGMDYLPVIYEDAPSLNNLSAKILCSYNRLTTSAGVFSSFGDADGERNDLFRWYTNVRNGKNTKQTPVDNAIRKHGLRDLTEILAGEFVKAHYGESIAGEYNAMLEYFGYLENSRVCVPVYTAVQKERVTVSLDNLTAELVLEDMKTALAAVSSATELTSVKHGVPAQDIANEVYHLLFGQINEKLVEYGMVASPEYHPGEGRYLKSFEIK